MIQAMGNWIRSVSMLSILYLENLIFINLENNTLGIKVLNIMTSGSSLRITSFKKIFSLFHIFSGLNFTQTIYILMLLKYVKHF